LSLEERLKKLCREIQFNIESWKLELGTGMQILFNSVTQCVRDLKNYLVKKGVLKILIFPKNIAIMKLLFKSKVKLKNIMHQ
jgi:hypothetical protein